MGKHFMRVTRDWRSLARLLERGVFVSEEDRGNYWAYRYVCIEPDGCGVIDFPDGAPDPEDHDYDDVDDWVWNSPQQQYGKVREGACWLEVGYDVEEVGDFDFTVDNDYLVEYEWDDDYDLVTTRVVRPLDDAEVEVLESVLAKKGAR